ncbi:DUF4238 domain-containing protein [Brevundimonas sp.]|uniref:DUF4238 domain-containing protein n=1 Tax=Brevundimonas sp. TaxID=1871086 RepID=UPI003D14374F
MPAPAKLHHYVPQVYLRQFTNSSGRLTAYRKDDPENPHPKLPREVGAQNNYYTQPLPDGSLDRGLEKFFQQSEDHWPSIIDAFKKDGQLPKALIEPFYDFMGSMKVRGPASRDAAELVYAEQVRMAGEMMERRGDLPRPPTGMEEALSLKNLTISINPHQSIHAMPPMLIGFSRVLDQVGFCLAINETDVDFITSDNPVVYFDPSMSEEHLRPYAIEHGPPIELLFPLTPKLMIVGHSDWAGPYSHAHFRSMRCNDRMIIRRANRFIARFGYREIYATDRSHDALVTKWANTSPIVANQVYPTENGTALLNQWVFGARPVKPKWSRTNESRAQV